MRRVTYSGRNIILAPTSGHTATLVWLHGLGDSSEGFSQYFSDPDLVFPSLKVVLLTADPHAVTINRGLVMNSWYDIETLKECTSVGAGAAESAAKVSEVMLQESELTKNLFIGGLSQGGVMSLYLGYHAYPGTVKGVVALSCYCFPIAISEERKQIPGLIMHGDADPLIDIRFGQQTYAHTLTGVNYEFKTIAGLPHCIDYREMVTVKDWIQAHTEAVVPWGRHLIVEPIAAHNATLIWMHGLGDSAHGFVDVFSDPRFTLPGMKTVLLTADEHPVTLNGGMVMNSWYDISTLANRTMGPDAIESAQKVSSIMLEESKKTENLFVGGFSQGGAMSLLLAYSMFPGILRGVVALSCYCFPMDISEDKKKIPALIYHGDADDVVQIRFAQQSYHQTLKGVNYTFNIVPNMSHSVDINELIDVKKWLQKLVSNSPTKL